MNSNDSRNAPLRDVAQNPEATARYLADVQRYLLELGKNLETLQMETRLHLRSTHVEGDRFYHAWKRAFPVEKALKGVLKQLEGLTNGLERSAYKRNAFADEVKTLPGKRHAKEMNKKNGKAAPPLQAAPDPAQGDASGGTPGYDGPASIFDMSERKSA